MVRKNTYICSELMSGVSLSSFLIYLFFYLKTFKLFFIYNKLLNKNDINIFNKQVLNIFSYTN
jgi:hypothetical protein